MAIQIGLTFEYSRSYFWSYIQKFADFPQVTYCNE